MKKVGRKTDMTPELIKEIKQCILDGNDIKTTATIIFNNSSNISKKEKERGVENYIQKFYNWHYENYLNISDKIEGWKRDRKVLMADNNIEDILALGIRDKDSLKVVADMAKFIKETLDKKHYSKQLNTDITTGGKPLPIININDISKDTIPSKDSQTRE